MKTVVISSLVLITGLAATSCKKGCTDPNAINYDENAKKDNSTCQYDDSYTIPTTYAFLDASGNSTVNYSGQTDRLNQLSEMVILMKSGTNNPVDAQALKDMFSNENGNGNGNFSFTSSKQLKDKCFALDQAMFETFMDQLAVASVDHASVASDGQAGTLSTGSSTYLFDANGVEPLQLIEKGLMGAVFLNQALNVYFGPSKMDVDNTNPVDPSAGKYYTTMEHHFDEAFGYFGVDIDFPTTIPDQFWGKYSDKVNAELNCNTDIMDNFLKGRAAISARDFLSDRDAAIQAIRTEWEEVSAYTAMSYLDDAIASFGTDDAKFLHVLSEAWAFAWNLRYAPVETRRMTNAEHDALMAMFPTNFWSTTIADLNNIKNTIDAKY